MPCTLSPRKALVTALLGMEKLPHVFYGLLKGCRSAGYGALASLRCYKENLRKMQYTKYVAGLATFWLYNVAGGVFALRSTQKMQDRSRAKRDSNETLSQSRT